MHSADDAVAACADLVGRAGARRFDIGHVNDDPVNPEWYAAAIYLGTRIFSDGHRSPQAAAIGLAERLLFGALCRCRRLVSLSGDRAGCHWRLVGKRWEPGCDAPPVRVVGKRGDLEALARAMSRDTGWFLQSHEREEE